MTEVGARHICGADAGGTKTECVVSSARGEVLAHALGRGVTFHGHEVRADTLQGLFDVVTEACASAGIVPHDLAHLVVGLAGVDTSERKREALRACQEWLPSTTVDVVNDAAVALEGAFTERPAAILMAGTGSIAYGEGSASQPMRVGGWGHVFGDEGSAYAISRDALRAVLRAADGRGAPTRLTEAALRHFALPDPGAVVALTELAAADPATAASFAPDVFSVWKEEDAVADEIVRRSARNLAELAITLLRKCEAREKVPVALAGTVLLRQAEYADLVAAEIMSVEPSATPVCSDATPVLGAAMRALHRQAMGAGVDGLPARRDCLRESFARFAEVEVLAP